MGVTQKAFTGRRAERPEWLTFAALAIAPAIGLGIARFAYALVLPDMRDSLDWGYAEAGWMNSSNALGYFLGALLAARVIARAGAFPVMAAGTGACVASLGLCAVLANVWGLNAARFIAGIGGSFSFVAGGVLAAQAAGHNAGRGTFLLALFYAGPGLGIFLSGGFVPLLAHLLGPGFWQEAWAGLALISLVLWPALAVAQGSRNLGTRDPRSAAPLARIMPLLGGYFLFGAGYIAYMTFMIAWVQAAGQGRAMQALFWSVIGLAAMASPWLWSRMLAAQRHGRGFAVLTLVTAAGAALPLVASTASLLLASAALFGSAFFAVVASTTAFVRRNLARPAWPSAIAALTVAFGLGQTIGPAATGALSDALGGLSGGIGLSALLLLLGALLGALQRDLT